MGRKKGMATWIREALADQDKVDDGLCSMIAVVHHIEGAPAKEIHVVRFTGSSSPRPAEELAELFEGKAQVYSQELNGVQQFELLAFYGTSKVPAAYYPFKISGVIDTGLGGMLSEGPTEKGQLAAAMRHTEAVLQFGLRAMALTHDAQGKIMEQLGDQNSKLMRENAEAFALVKNMIVERSSEEHQFKMAELAAVQSAQFKAALMKLAPPLVNTLTGKEVFPQPFADQQLIEAIAEKLQPEHLAKLAEVLPPEIVGMIASRFSDILESKQLAQVNGNVQEELGDDSDS
jgi:hypothetical protein